MEVLTPIARILPACCSSSMARQLRGHRRMAGESNTGQRNQVASIQRAFELGFGPFVTGILQQSFVVTKSSLRAIPLRFSAFRPGFHFDRRRRCQSVDNRCYSVNDRSFAFGGIGHLKYTKANRGISIPLFSFTFCMVLSFVIVHEKHNVKGKARLDGRICRGYERNS